MIPKIPIKSIVVYLCYGLVIFLIIIAVILVACSKHTKTITKPATAIKTKPHDNISVPSGGDAEEFVKKIDSERKKPYDSLIAEKAKKYNLPKEKIHEIVNRESRYDKNARSKDSCFGLMQLKKNIIMKYGVTDWRNAEMNVDAGCHYLADLIREKGSWDKARAQYEGRIK